MLILSLWKLALFFQISYKITLWDNGFTYLMGWTLINSGFTPIFTFYSLMYFVSCVHFVKYYTKYNIEIKQNPTKISVTRRPSFCHRNRRAIVNGKCRRLTLINADYWAESQSCNLGYCPRDTKKITFFKFYYQYLACEIRYKRRKSRMCLFRADKNEYNNKNQPWTSDKTRKWRVWLL